MSRGGLASDAPVLGAVLVGGRSSRMGTAKSLLEIDGVPFARRVADALGAAGCDPVVAIGPVELCADVDHVADLYPGEGPLGAILTALTTAAGGAAVVAACDLPWLDEATLRALGTAAEASATDVVMARSTRLEPLCALWLPSALAELQRRFVAGERAVRRAVADLSVVEVPVDARAVRNVNTPDDLGIG